MKPDGMKVAVLGGYGVFGSRLAELLMRDGHEVVVAGRSLAKAQSFTDKHGGTPLELDLHGDLAALADSGAEVVVDAAGPFQHYQTDPLRVADFCLRHDMSYLDLSDDAAFTKRIAQLNDLAVSKKHFALSGASSVPALSAAVVHELAKDLSDIDTIDIAIVPGNNAPRGRSVVASVLAQIGAPLRIWRHGNWQTVTGWSAPRRYILSHRLRRTAWCIGAPDLELFPRHFRADTVSFRAGTELFIMNRAIAGLAALRRIGLFRPTRRFDRFATWAYRMLKPFGSQVGGMVITVSGQKDGHLVRNEWILVAKTGDGPYVPTIPVRALLRQAHVLPPGARPCVSDLSLHQADEAMADLDIETRMEATKIPPLFARVLGDKWESLPQKVRDLHQVADSAEFTGLADVERGNSVLARLIALVFRFPEEGIDIPVSVTKQRGPNGEVWQRTFGEQVFRSRLRHRQKTNRITEQFGAFVFELNVHVCKEAILLPVRRGWLLGIPLPKFLLPKSEAREYVAGGSFRFDVALYAPFGGGRIVRYRGHLSQTRKAS